MGIISSIRNRLRLKRLRNSEPQMLYGMTNSDGTYLPDSRIGSSTVINDKKGLNLADNVFIGHFNFIEASNGITIKEGCQITNYVSILSHSSHISIRLYGKHYRKVTDHKGYVRGAVNIGKYTFIGPHTTIMPGTNIGKGCLISAFSLVQGDFPDFSVIKGNPAKVVGSTKTLDARPLRDEELQKYYNEWAEEN